MLPTRRRAIVGCALFVLGVAVTHALDNSNHACVQRLKAAVPAAETVWIDPDTPDTACGNLKCRQNYTSCMGFQGFPDPYGGPLREPPRPENMLLVFSDEFNHPYRDFGPGKDYKWQALDLLYVNGDKAGFRQKAITIRDGKLLITASREPTKAPFSAHWGDQLSLEVPYTSGFLQGWNKFCYTGGYLEIRVKMPGDDQKGGFWPALFTLGNLGRAGYLRSTEGVWPWSYDTCDLAATQTFPWSDTKQLINNCNAAKGRGSPEIDLFEIGVWQAGDPELSTSYAVAPIMPRYTTWMNSPGGMYFPTYQAPMYSGTNGWSGDNSFYNEGESKWVPRPGSKLADYYSGTHRLNASFFTDFYRFGFDWKPNEYIRWYINDVLIQEVNKNALKAISNNFNESVGDRLIPLEPSYINIALAMSDNFAPIHPDVPLPSSMEIDYVRIWQQKEEVNIGCDTPDYPTQAYIDAHRSSYMVSGLDGFEDFVGDSRVIGPTRADKPIAGSSSDSGSSIAAIIGGVVGGVGALLLIGLIVFLWVRHKKKKQEAEAAANAIELGKNKPGAAGNQVMPGSADKLASVKDGAEGQQQPEKPPSGVALFFQDCGRGIKGLFHRVCRGEQMTRHQRVMLGGPDTARRQQVWGGDTGGTPNRPPQTVAMMAAGGAGRPGFGTQQQPYGAPGRGGYGRGVDPNAVYNMNMNVR
ncbi:hypothetical protein HYH03_007762 [Edaphochlamys debaryana]|uniref:GH16 domain-containing protein n=1 Tax=Edaphochlamys debaryana TaxID=47281 RepID=A0A836C060_9CHLO|nr:hypothetical protein HYH03_007762 [Edaphochlamys debaryana]|eukprot:KAG2494124.1 hypothetical protein HYH03_007762 [Edaphochlamys debaryana]